MTESEEREATEVAAAAEEAGEERAEVVGEETTVAVDVEADAAATARLRSIVESLLFAAGEPVGVGRIEKIAKGYDRKAIVRILGELASEYEDGTRGIRLIQVAGGWQLRTPRENAEFVRQLREQRPVRLSRPALETLAIIAYRQPVTRAEIEAIRGVDVDAVMATLLERRLIRVLGRKDVIGHPLLYGTSAEFLEMFGLKDLRSLPTLEELGASIEVLERAAANADESSAERDVAPVEDVADPTGTEPSSAEVAEAGDRASSETEDDRSPDEHSESGVTEADSPAPRSES